MDPVKLFYSYSHKDKTLREELGKHLTSLRTDGTCVDWHDGEIRLGAEWDDEIKTKLRTADFVLLLVSADFLASKYIRTVELTDAIERKQRKECQVVPILLRDVDFSGELFSRFQGLPSDMRAVTSWPNQDAAFTDVAKGLRREFEKFRSERTTVAAAQTAAVIAIAAANPVSLAAATSGVLATASQETTVPVTPATGLPPGESMSETQARNRVLATTSKEGFQGLSGLMANPKIKAFVAEQATELVAADQALQILVDFKVVHDLLHDLQFYCYNYIFQEARKAEEQIVWRLLVKPSQDLKGIVEALEIASKLPTMGNEDFLWLEQLKLGQEQFLKARSDASLPPLIDAARTIKTILEMRPTIFDKKLCTAARTLPLVELEDALSTIREKLSKAALASEKGQKFKDGVEALPQLNQNLQKLTEEHTRWQVVATTLWSINALIDQDLEGLRKSWDRLRERLQKICGGNPAPWATTILSETARLDGLLKEPVPDDPKEKRRWTARVIESYESCSSEGELRFYQVDVSLLELCTELRIMHTALAAILQELP